ncbi:Chain A, 4ank: A Designed Ankyrin Repeat Protein With Four Identical Consensus Repeats [Ectocarpus siliculosus]|uniref:Chain A, 4ank: A Designed Ankyrin Repeat Protein With Four Identical Consensus Repeats n=1 Tax=Ectocarpus siliculosus TaxID=2880 RepID=D7FKI9_ECTSI|nr:Chain A, 4ank: A Designed Ankyrin Repeat Protein With Four Identical Consensus Repeats [Ectocarpus siliculosus]|eukprot:CBJ29391.1 Chain A, 4ank: A Designed Ankyrin Repeat Protein With Four Identical Consensus Repeats [Ectocarpus siliculosus]
MRIMAVPGTQGKSLHLACMDGDAAAVQRWLDAGNFVDKRDSSGRTGLHQAAKCGQSEVASLLLGAHAEVDSLDKQQRTPLHLCSETGHLAVVKNQLKKSSVPLANDEQVLLGFKANINAVDFNGDTPLSKAARAGMVDVIDALLAAGAEIEIRDVGNNIAGDVFNKKVPLETRDKVIAMRNSRQQEIAVAKQREEAVRLAERAKTGQPRNRA